MHGASGKRSGNCFSLFAAALLSERVNPRKYTGENVGGTTAFVRTDLGSSSLDAALPAALPPPYSSLLTLPPATCLVNACRGGTFGLSLSLRQTAPTSVVEPSSQMIQGCRLQAEQAVP